MHEDLFMCIFRFPEKKNKTVRPPKGAEALDKKLTFIKSSFFLYLFIQMLEVFLLRA